MYVEEEEALKLGRNKTGISTGIRYTEFYTLYTSQHPYPDAKASFFSLAQALFGVKRGNKTSSARTEDILTVASLEPALQGALQPHTHFFHSPPSHYIKDTIPLVPCLWGKP